MTTISPFSLSLPYRTENRRFSTLSCTKTGSTQPKLSAACFVVQSCLADADFVVFSNYCLIGTRQRRTLFLKRNALRGSARTVGAHVCGACVTASLRVARHKAQRNFFKKEAIYGLFFELQPLVANFSTPLGGLFARLLLS